MCEYCEIVNETYYNDDDWAWGQLIDINLMFHGSNHEGLVRLDYHMNDSHDSPIDDTDYYLVKYSRRNKPKAEGATNKFEYCPFCGRDLYPELHNYDDDDEE